MRVVVPNAVTLMGALAALLSMVWAPGHPYWACNALIAASLFDMIDGRIARALGAESAFGQQLDSLVDLVAFGVAPAFLAYVTTLHQLGAIWQIPIGVAVMFAFVACSAVRLARFNSRQGGSHQFQGIPTPVSALLVVTTVMAWHEVSLAVFAQTWFACTVMLAAAALMVVPLPFPSFKSFRTRIGMVLYFGTMCGGVAMLFLGLPGGTVLFGFVSLYVLRGLAETVLRLGGRPRDDEPSSSPSS